MLSTGSLRCARDEKRFRWGITFGVALDTAVSPADHDQYFCLDTKILDKKIKKFQKSWLFIVMDGEDTKLSPFPLCGSLGSFAGVKICIERIG